MDELSPESRALYEILMSPTKEEYEARFLDYKKGILNAVKISVNDKGKQPKSTSESIESVHSTDDFHEPAASISPPKHSAAPLHNRVHAPAVVPASTPTCSTASLALVNEETASVSSPTTSATTATASSASSSTTRLRVPRDTAPAAIPMTTAASRAVLSTKHDLTPGARRIYDFLVGGSSTPTSTAPLRVPSSAVPIGGISERAAATPSSTSASAISTTTPAAATSASTSTSVSRPASKDDLSPEARRIYDYLVGNSAPPPTTDVSTNLWVRTELDAVHDAVEDLAAPTPSTCSTVCRGGDTSVRTTPSFQRAVPASPESAPASPTTVSTMLPSPTEIKDVQDAVDFGAADFVASAPTACLMECPSHDASAYAAALIPSATPNWSTTTGGIVPEPAASELRDKALDMDVTGDNAPSATICLPGGPDHSIGGEDPMSVSLTPWKVHTALNEPPRNSPRPPHVPLIVLELCTWSPSSTDCSCRSIETSLRLLTEAYKEFNIGSNVSTIAPWPPPSCTCAGASLIYGHELCRNAQKKRGMEFSIVPTQLWEVYNMLSRLTGIYFPTELTVLEHWLIVWDPGVVLVQHFFSPTKARALVRLDGSPGHKLMGNFHSLAITCELLYSISVDDKLIAERYWLWCVKCACPSITCELHYSISVVESLLVARYWVWWMRCLQLQLDTDMPSKCVIFLQPKPPWSYLCPTSSSVAESLHIISVYLEFNQFGLAPSHGSRTYGCVDIERKLIGQQFKSWLMGCYYLKCPRRGLLYSCEQIVTESATYFDSQYFEWQNSWYNCDKEFLESFLLTAHPPPKALHFPWDRGDCFASAGSQDNLGRVDDGSYCPRIDIRYINTSTCWEVTHTSDSVLAIKHIPGWVLYLPVTCILQCGPKLMTWEFARSEDDSLTCTKRVLLSWNPGGSTPVLAVTTDSNWNSNQLKFLYLTWDPGGYTLHRLEGKPNFKKGGLSATSLLGWSVGRHSWAVACSGATRGGNIEAYIPGGQLQRGRLGRNGKAA